MMKADTPFEMLARRMDEIGHAAETANTYGACLRLDIFADEARTAFWERSSQDGDARQAMWSSRFAATEHALSARKEVLRPKGLHFPAELDPIGPTIETFFDDGGSHVRRSDAGRVDRYLQQIWEAERRLGIPIIGRLRDLFGHDNGGYTDFVFHPRTPWARYNFSRPEPYSLDEHPFSIFREEWEEVLENPLIASVQLWKSVETFLADKIAAILGEEDNEISQDRGWRESLPGLDRLIVLATWQHKRTMNRTMVCLDYRHGPHPGIAIVEGLLDEPLRVTHEWSSFATFFDRLRRWPIHEVDGVVQRRGLRIIAVLEGGFWRPPYG